MKKHISRGKTEETLKKLKPFPEKTQQNPEKTQANWPKTQESANSSWSGFTGGHGPSFQPLGVIFQL